MKDTAGGKILGPQAVDRIHLHQRQSGQAYTLGPNSE